MQPDPDRASQAPATFKEERDWPGLIALYLIAFAISILVGAEWPWPWGATP